MPTNVKIDGAKIKNWESFHDQFAEAFGFPDFYGRNMDAWIDCMTCLDDPEAGVTSIHVTPGEVLVICLSAVPEFKKRCPEIYDALVDCVAFVNFRRVEQRDDAILALSFNG